MPKKVNTQKVVVKQLKEITPCVDSYEFKSGYFYLVMVEKPKIILSEDLTKAKMQAISRIFDTAGVKAVVMQVRDSSDIKFFEFRREEF